MLWWGINQTLIIDSHCPVSFRRITGPKHLNQMSGSPKDLYRTWRHAEVVINYWKRNAGHCLSRTEVEDPWVGFPVILENVRMEICQSHIFINSAYFSVNFWPIPLYYWILPTCQQTISKRCKCRTLRRIQLDSSNLFGCFAIRCELKTKRWMLKNYLKRV